MTIKVRRIGQWWSAPAEERFVCYYLCLRHHYEMTAIDAFNYAKKAFALYPDFMANPAQTLRNAIQNSAKTEYV